ncbi:hypothetical protein ACFX2C_007721 [Malus domestica]
MLSSTASSSARPKTKALAKPPTLNPSFSTKMPLKDSRYLQGYIIVGFSAATWAFTALPRTNTRSFSSTELCNENTMNNPPPVVPVPKTNPILEPKQGNMINAEVVVGLVSFTPGESNFTTQVVTIQNDNSNFSAGIKLDENNYSLWHQVIEMKIAGREKHGHFSGDTKQPAVTDPLYNKWRAENCQVKSWLFDAMTPNQMKRFIRYDTAMQVWDAIKRTYSDDFDEAKIYNLHKRSFTMKQNGAPIANYYSNLTEIFQELDQLSPTNMKDPDDILSRQQEIERLRVYIFLAGLDNKFDQIRGEILKMEPKPGLE